MKYIISGVLLLLTSCNVRYTTFELNNYDNAVKYTNKLKQQGVKVYKNYPKKEFWYSNDEHMFDSLYVVKYRY